MDLRRLRLLCVVAVAVFLVPHGFAQGTLEDYERARSFLYGNLRHSVYVADVSPHWIDKTNRFWYHKLGPAGGEFLSLMLSTTRPAPPLITPSWPRA